MVQRLTASLVLLVIFSATAVGQRDGAPLFRSKEFEGRSARGIYGDVIEEIDYGRGAGAGRGVTP